MAGQKLFQSYSLIVLHEQRILVDDTQHRVVQAFRYTYPGVLRWKTPPQKVYLGGADTAESFQQREFKCGDDDSTTGGRDPFFLSETIRHVVTKPRRVHASVSARDFTGSPFWGHLPPRRLSARVHDAKVKQTISPLCPLIPWIIHDIIR